MIPSGDAAICSLEPYEIQNETLRQVRAAIIRLKNKINQNTSERAKTLGAAKPTIRSILQKIECAGQQQIP